MIDPTPWVSRAHRGPRAERLALTAAERRQVLKAMGPAKAEKRVVLRSEAMLLLASGVGNEQTAELVGVHVRTVERWRRRARERGAVAALHDARRPGRPPSLSQARKRLK